MDLSSLDGLRRVPFESRKRRDAPVERLRRSSRGEPRREYF
jgi:hypothetical protein